MAAPTMPASLRKAAGNSLARTWIWGKNFSCFLLTPPPTMMTSGQKSNSMCWKY